MNPKKQECLKCWGPELCLTPSHSPQASHGLTAALVWQLSYMRGQGRGGGAALCLWGLLDYHSLTAGTMSCGVAPILVTFALYVTKYQTKQLKEGTVYFGPRFKKEHSLLWQGSHGYRCVRHLVLTHSVQKALVGRTKVPHGR